MTHVQISSQDGAYKVLVDGVDLSNAVLREGFKVETPTDWDMPATVTMTIAADVLDVDLPAAVIQAAREAEPVNVVAVDVECPGCKAAEAYKAATR